MMFSLRDWSEMWGIILGAQYGSKRGDPVNINSSLLCVRADGVEDLSDIKLDDDHIYESAFVNGMIRVYLSSFEEKMRLTFKM